jgi:hypothetical protein
MIMSKKAKNVHLIRTDGPSRLGRFVDTGNLFLRTPNDLPRGENVHVYITVEEISGLENNIWVYNNGRVWFWQNTMALVSNNKPRKIILTTDPILIQSGVQAIPDDFLEFLVQNPSCESVGVELFPKFSNNLYGIILPKEEPKQEFTSVIPQEQNTISFVQDNGAREILKLCENGDIFIKGKLAENDKEVVDALREFLKGQGFLK